MAKAIARPDRRIIIHYNQSGGEADALAGELENAGCKAFTIRADLSSLTEASGLIDRTNLLIGEPLTGLVNSASVFDYDEPSKFDIEKFQTSIDVNLRAPMVLSTRFFETCNADVDNCVVNMLDQKLWNLNPDFLSYTTAKYALWGVTQMLSMGFSPKCRVCAIAPGLLFPSFDQTEEEFEKVGSVNLMERPIDPVEVGRALDFILDNAGFNGTVLHVDNGQRFVPLDRDVMFSVRE